MACRLLVAKPLPEAMITYHQLDPQVQWIFLSKQNNYWRNCFWKCRLPKLQPSYLGLNVLMQNMNMQRIWCALFSWGYNIRVLWKLEINLSIFVTVLRKSYDHDDVIKWKHFPRNWPFMREILRSPVNSPHKGQCHGALRFSLICKRINDWANNGEAGDLRRHLAHYDITAMVLG